MAKHKPKSNFSKVFNNLNCDKYSETGKTVDEGLNCFSFIINYLRETDHDILLEDEQLINDYTYSNIVSKWRVDDETAVQTVIDSLTDFVDKIDMSQIRPGDILILIDQRKNKKFPAVYVANGKVITMTKKGTARLRISEYKVTDIFRGKNL